MREKEKGFSIVELMVAIFILSTCLLLIIGLFTFLFNSTKKGVDLTAGTAAAELMLEEFLYQNEAAIYSGTYGPSTPISITKSLNNVNYLCDINVSNAVNNSLRRVDATIYWWTSPTGASGYGSRKYIIKNDDGTLSEVETAKGYVAEYGSVKTKITKFVFLPPP
ncbi:MAG: prepilin-type N-terminal cleavage/methylation domain-containing protein [Candidatus Eremiobacteraeota bacterium]|nr:prepilin-type N-terminal cleavage/methylation domain-containing protein [Candidatus Eremiobacteraeota bacterium]